jgi:hypothetical protein
MGTFDADFEPYTQLERKGMGYKYVNLFWKGCIIENKC